MPRVSEEQPRTDVLEWGKKGELLEGFKQRSGQICVQKIIVVTWLKIYCSGGQQKQGTQVVGHSSIRVRVGGDSGGDQK